MYVRTAAMLREIHLFQLALGQLGSYSTLCALNHAVPKAKIWFTYISHNEIWQAAGGCAHYISMYGLETRQQNFD